MIDFGRVISFNEPISVRFYVTSTRVIIIRVQFNNSCMNPLFLESVFLDQCRVG